MSRTMFAAVCLLGVAAATPGLGAEPSCKELGEKTK